MSLFTNILREIGLAPQLDAVEAVETAISKAMSSPTPENLAAAATAAATATATVASTVTAPPTATILAAAPVAIDDVVNTLTSELKTYLTNHYGETGTVAADMVVTAASALETAFTPKT